MEREKKAKISRFQGVDYIDMTEKKSFGSVGDFLNYENSSSFYVAAQIFKVPIFLISHQKVDTVVASKK